MFSPEAEVVRVLNHEAQILLDAAKRIQEDPTIAQNFKKALLHSITALKGGHKLVITGIGKSGKIAHKIASTIRSTGSSAVYLHPSEAMHGDLGLIEDGDVLIALSQSGQTTAILELISQVKKRSVFIIAMSGSRNSLLTQSSDAWLDTSVESEACPYQLAPTSSTTLAMALGDAFALTLMQLRGFGADVFARNHPSGSLGHKLFLQSKTVEDVMVPLQANAVVSPEASVREIALLATEKKLGAVLVLDPLQKKLLGLITDGDLRKALLEENSLLALKAKDVMTRTPVTVQPQSGLLDAVGLMENRPSQIAVLPVVSETSQCVGLIRLHDIVQTL